MHFFPENSHILLQKKVINGSCLVIKNNPANYVFWFQKMAQTNKANPKKGEIHVLSLDGGGSRGIMESIMLGHVMDLSTLMTEKPSKITEILDNFQLDGPEVGKKIQSLIELENLSPIHPTEAFQYIVGK